MKPQTEVPACERNKSGERQLPAGSGVLIGIAASILFWGVAAVVLALHA